MQLQLAAIDGELVDVDDVQLVGAELPAAGVGEAVTSTPIAGAITERYLAAEAERIAARAATAGTRRQYASMYRSFATWLAAQLGRAPLVADLDADVIAAYGRHLATGGGRGGRPAAPATVRVYVSMIRALAAELGLRDDDYRNLLRVPDRRRRDGKRNYALLRILGDCGLRSIELRRLRAQDLRRPRSNGRFFKLYVHGKGGREREVSVPAVTKDALDAWTRVHPLASGSGLRRLPGWSWNFDGDPARDCDDQTVTS